ARLEEFPRAEVERVAGRPVVQYCGQIMPLLDVDSALRPAADPARPPGTALADGKETFQVVVYARPDLPVGLVGERILAIVQPDGGAEGPPSRPGVERTAVIQGHVTELLDVEALVRAVGGER